jgi:two-component system C4-dicarboxylate transport response regulator DctD
MAGTGRMINAVLLVDDDASVREALAQTLELADLNATVAASYIEAKDHVTREFGGVVVTDIRMPGKDGFQLLDYVHDVDPELPVILLTGEGDIPMAVRGISAGAFDFLEKPCAPGDLLTVVQRALKARALVLENRTLRHQLEAGDAASRMLFGHSKQAEELRDRVRGVAKSTAEVLITGEPGSGTSKVAEVIHLLSDTAMLPFRKHSAASLLPDGLAQAFQECGTGTLFLDEIAAMTPETQFALLDLLDRDAGARVIACSYSDMAAEVATGRFNADLYYKLDVMNVRIPSLRDRREDIPVLFRHYVAIACEQAALPQPRIDANIVAGLMAQDWPGNARALMNVAMRFAMGLGDPASVDGGDPGLSEQLALVEKSLLMAALQRNDGNATLSAQQLKLPRKTFYDKLSRHGIKAEIYRT